VLLVGSVPLLTVLLRIVATVGVGWAERRYGVPLVHHLPLAAALLLVLHTPVMFGSLTGLLLLEDRDAGLLRPLAATRASLSVLLTYRLAATAALTTVALTVCLPLSGVGHPAGAVGVLATAVAAGAVSVVPALLLAGIATTRVQGVAVMKVIGLPLYLPLATWFIAGQAAWLAAPIPTAWVVWAAWAGSPAAALGFAVGAVALAAAAGVALARRWRRRATAG
jgi:fluoroquinolone transport system permease protein